MINEEDARSAIVVSFDQHNDLAILKIDGSPLQSKSISLAGNQAKIGSNIAVLGFPLPELLGTKLQANTGEISSHHGLRNDPRFYRITANVQGGNSGGPVLNQYGEAIGVVSSKLNDLTTLKNKGELPQNINFAVKNHYLKSLIEAAHIKTSNYPKKIKPIDDVIEDFKRSVFLVITETKE
jgi:S1-C subfamily serine protease